MTQKDLKNGQEFRFKTPETDNDTREAEISFSEFLDQFCIWFNGQLFSFKRFEPMRDKANQLITEFELIAA